MLFEHFKILDLTHPLTANVPTWDGSCGFCQEISKDYDRIFRTQNITMIGGIGTHIDAPSHRIQGGISIADIPLEQLIVPIHLIDVSKKSDSDYELSTVDLQNYEEEHGLIGSNSLVIGYTGWSRYWSDPVAYRNVNEKGQMHYPAFSAAAAQLLVKRNVAGIGIDTLSPDCQDQTYPVHKIILGAGKYIIENIADCSQIPSKGAYAIALPLRTEDGSESPIRLVGLVPRQS